MTPGPTLQKSFIFRFQVVHLSFGVLKIVFSGVVLAQLSNTPCAIKNGLLIVCFLLRESDLHRGLLVFGMHIAGMSALATADRMDMTPNGVRHSIAISETIVHGGRDETIPSAPTTPSPKKKEIAKRRRRVDALLRKRGRDGNPVIGSARDMQRALLEEGVEVDRSTVTRDMVATGARFLARPTTADLTEAHKQTRVELGRDLLQVDPNVIIFTDESLFDCSDPMSHEWVVKGEKPRPRPVAKWTAKVHVWEL